MFATSFLFIDCGYIIPQDKVFFCNEVTLIKKSGAQKSTGFLKDELRFPQTVEVAVGVDRLDLIALAEREADLRLFAGMQFLMLIALLGLERYLAPVQSRMTRTEVVSVCVPYQWQLCLPQPWSPQE